jgi:phage replication initiation protein
MIASPVRKAMSVKDPLADLHQSSAGLVRPVMTDDGVKVEILPAVLEGQRVAVDYCSLTVGEAILRRITPESKPFTDEEFCKAFAAFVESEILLLTGKDRAMHKTLPRGIFGYSFGIQIGNYGLVAAGGNGSTLYLSLTGHAFACCDGALCQRLFDFCQASPSARLTRVDLCFDDFAGEMFTPDAMLEAWHRDEFTATRGNRKRPRLEKRGDWERGDPDQTGRTLYIGARSAGKLFRFYEKGKQLGDKSSPWVRAEAELRNNVFHLVADMLINPTGYFVSLAPALTCVGLLAQPARLERIAREGVASVERVLEIIRTQYGVHLHILRNEFFATDEELLDAVTRTGVVPPVLQRAMDFSKAIGTAPVAPNQQAE